MYKLFFVAFAFFFSSISNAALVDHGTYLTDTETNVDWLYFDQTANMTYNEVLDEMQVGGLFEGWRLTTGRTMSKYNLNETFVELMNGDVSVVHFFTTIDEDLGTGLDDWAYVWKTELPNWVYNEGDFFDVVNSRRFDLSTALVRTVPLPGSALLFLSGTALLFSSIRRRKIHKKL